MPVQPTVRGSFLWALLFLVSFGKAFTRIASCGHDLLAAYRAMIYVGVYIRLGSGKVADSFFTPTILNK
jgi:hypothetical protein